MMKIFFRLTVIMTVCIYIGAHEIGTDHPKDCSTWPPPCSQLCRVKEGDHECSCHQGYKLDDDHRHCLAEQWREGPYLVYTQEKNMAIKSLMDPLSQLHELPSKQVADVRIGTFAVDVGGLRIFYSSTMPGFSGADRDLNIIKVTDLEGKNDTEVITRGLLKITSVAMDWVGKVLYIGDRGLHQIIACSLTTHHCSTIKHVGDPASVALNPLQRKLYWSDCSSAHSQLYWSNMDGTDTEVLTQLSREGCIEELQVDLLQDTLYWINRGISSTQLINSMRLDTKRVTDISRMTSALALFADDLFWTYTSESDQYLSLMTDVFAEDKFDMEVPVEDDSYRRHDPTLFMHAIVNVPVHMAIVHKVQQPEAPNPCERSACSHLCMLKSGDKTSCGCPSGSSLDTDGFTCTPNWKVPSVVVVNDRRLVRIVPDLIGSNDLDIIYEAPDDVTALAFDWSSSSLFFSSNRSSGESNSISRLRLDQTRIKEEIVYKETYSIVDMEVDWLSNNIYWINYESKDIMVGRLDGSAKMSLMQNINKSGIVEHPTALALHLSERKLYYSDCGTHPHIGVCDLTGQDCLTDLIDVKGGCASDLFLERSTGWLYWTDNRLHKIMKSDPAQNSAEAFRIASVPISVVAGGEEIFWTGGYMSGILHATERVYRDTIIHFGVDGFKKMIYFADFVQQPQEKNECGVGNKRCTEGVCIEQMCLTSDTESISSSKPLTTSDYHRPTAVEQPASAQTTITSDQEVTLPKTSKIKKQEYPKKECNCLNGGECDVEAGGVCRCSVDYQGARCELKKSGSANSPISDPLSPPADDQLMMYVGVAVIGVALLLAVVITAVCIHKRCSASRRRHDDDETKTLGTPLYENPSGGKKIHTLSIPRPTTKQENDYC